MKKKIIVLFIALIIFTTLTTSFIFQTYRKIDEYRDAETEIRFLEERLLGQELEYDNKTILNEIMREYSLVLNGKITIAYRDGDLYTYNKKDKTIIYSELLRGKNEYIDYIKLSLYEEEINKNYFKSILISVVTSLVLMFLLLGRISGDLEKDYCNLLNSLDKNILGDYTNLKFRSRDKNLRAIEDRFNQMNSVIKMNLEDCNQATVKLRSIISSMNEGLLAVDLSGNIIFYNEFADLILGIGQGRKLDEIKEASRFIGLSDAESLVVDFNEPATKKIRISARDIRDINYSIKKLGRLYLLEDITQFEKLLESRKNFASNIGHELKTPITTILGFSETLEEDESIDEETRKKFLNIISMESHRMNRLLDELLFISEIESNAVELNKEAISLEDILDEVFFSLEAKAEARGIRLEKDLARKTILIYSDYIYLRHLLLNLIDNGIKYGKTGGFVHVGISESDKYIYIDVLDNGIGIDQKNIARIFERFYRVDKSRSNIVEGTGLGLSIVKHIVSSFNGKIDLKSQEKVGTLISVRLPKDI